MGCRRATRRRAVAVWPVAAVSIAVLFLGACSNGVVDRTSGAERAAAAKRATRDLAAAESRDLGCRNIVTSEERRSTPAPEQLVLLTDAYAAAERCWDRITFMFTPTGADVPPGYDVEYRKPPFDDGPHDCPVDTLGDAFLHITFTPAAEYDTRAPGRPKLTYLGNLLIRLDQMHHTVMVCKRTDGDGTVMWVIGLDEKRPFTVDAANGPPRVTVYVMN